MTNDTIAARFDGVVKTFGAVRAVDGLDLTITAGETVALLGPNGAGKSTSIGMLLGLFPPDRGEISLFGTDVATAVRAGRIGAMLQEAKLPRNARVGELIDFVRAIYPDPVPRADVLATAGLTDLADRPVDRLSGGQSQRVRFALAFAGGPDLLVLDEPTAALDVEARRDFWTAMRGYADRGHTVLFSTHYLEEADANADRIVVIGDGRLRANGTPEQIKRTVTGRTVAIDLDGRGAAGLETLPGVVSVTVRGDRARLRSSDADATVVALVRERGGVTNLEVTGADLEEAFLALTDTPDPGTADIMEGSRA